MSSQSNSTRPPSVRIKLESFAALVRKLTFPSVRPKVCDSDYVAQFITAFINQEFVKCDVSAFTQRKGTEEGVKILLWARLAPKVRPLTFS